MPGAEQGRILDDPRGAVPDLRRGRPFAPLGTGWEEDLLRDSGGQSSDALRVMERAEFHQHIGSENLLPTVEAALERPRVLLEGSVPATHR